MRLLLAVFLAAAHTAVAAVRVGDKGKVTQSYLEFSSPNVDSSGTLKTCAAKA